MNTVVPILSHGLAHMSGFPRALEIMESLENHGKSSMHGKTMGFEKKTKNHRKSWNCVKLFDETTSSQKTSCQTHKTCVSDS